MKFNLEYLLQRFHPHIAIDCGSSMTRIQFCPARGKVIEEQTIIVLDQQRKKILATGKDALQLLGKVASDVSVIQPVCRGAVVDSLAIERFFRQLFERVLGKYFLFQPSVLVAIPAGSTDVERDVWEEVFLHLGVRNIHLIDQPLAAAIGAGIPIAQGSGNIVIHLGSDLTEIALISLGTVVRSNTGRFGSSDIDKEIRRIVRQKYEIDISPVVAEQVKIELGYLESAREKKSVVVSGQDIRQARPKEIEIPQGIVHKAMERYTMQVLQLITTTLAETPAELAADVVDKGFLLTGGGANVKGLDRYLTQELGVPVSTADQPATCVISGIQIIYQHLDQFRLSVMRK